MNSVNENETSWVEKFRPQCVEDTILPDRIMKLIRPIVEKKEISNMLLSGSAGIGKTTIAKAICKDLGADYIVINASDERGLDVIRTTIKQFASTTSVFGGNNTQKIIILDESDHLLPDTQAALRNPIEKYSKNCKFIFTANYPSRLSDALHSRLTHIKFDPTKTELVGMQAKFLKRLTQILKHESVEYELPVLMKLVSQYYPDCRKILGELQIYSRGGPIDAGIFSCIADAKVSDLIEMMKKQDFAGCRQWAELNAESDTSSTYQKIYNHVFKEKCIQDTSIPSIIKILNDYQRYDSIVPSKELHITAMAVEILSEVDFK